MNRRTFLNAALTAAGFPCVVRPSALGAAGAPAPSEKIVMACIGVGSMGSGHLRRFMQYADVRIVAACDLRRAFRRKAKERVDEYHGDSGCAVYHDYRELLARDDIDAVTVVTPDHWHALIGLEAARRGKHMYYEKPMSMSVTEDKALRAAVNRYNVVFQFGTQQRSDHRFRTACQLARSGRLGRLRTILVGSHPSIECPNQPTQPQPDKNEFDYDMWLGPAPWSPYTFLRAASRAEGTPGHWTFISDYSLGGVSGAWGIHDVDIAQWAIGADDTGPVEIEGAGVFPRDGLNDTALEWVVRHKYANGVEMIHMNTKNALKHAEPFKTHFGCGILIQGNDGWAFCNRDFVDAHPKSLLEEQYSANEIRLPVSNDHRRNFLDCIKTGRKTICPVDTAARSDTVCHLDHIAMRLGRKIRWDPVREQCIDDETANRMLTRPMRAPWHL